MYVIKNGNGYFKSSTKVPYQRQPFFHFEVKKSSFTRFLQEKKISFGFSIWKKLLRKNSFDEKKCLERAKWFFWVLFITDMKSTFFASFAFKSCNAHCVSRNAFRRDKKIPRWI